MSNLALKRLALRKRIRRNGFRNTNSPIPKPKAQSGISIVLGVDDLGNPLTATFRIPRSVFRTSDSVRAASELIREYVPKTGRIVYGLGVTPYISWKWNIHGSILHLKVPLEFRSMQDVRWLSEAYGEILRKASRTSSGRCTKTESES